MEGQREAQEGRWHGWVGGGQLGRVGRGDLPLPFQGVSWPDPHLPPLHLHVKRFHQGHLGEIRMTNKHLREKKKKKTSISLVTLETDIEATFRYPEGIFF